MAGAVCGILVTILLHLRHSKQTHPVAAKIGALSVRPLAARARTPAASDFTT
jgi:hypothetical protein